MTASTSASTPRRVGATRDALILAWRNYKHYVRVPTLLVFSTMTPLIFLLLFRYVLGGSIVIPGVDYVDYLVPGVLVQAIAFGATQTGVGLAIDLERGVSDRFRALPISRSAVLAGRALADTALKPARSLARHPRSRSSRWCPKAPHPRVASSVACFPEEAMKTILHVVDTTASRADLYRALTTQEGLAGWWTTQVTASPEVGSIVDFRFDDDFGPDMEITRLEPDTAVEWRCVGGHEPWADNTFHFELADIADGRTRLRFRQAYAQELSDDAYGIYNYNWGYYLESLRLLAEEGPGHGKPYQPIT